MSASTDSTILIPIDVSGPETPPNGIIGLLGSVNTVLLGYYPVPSQAAPAQIKHDKESEAAQRLESISKTLTDDDHNVTEVLVFTHDREDTIDRIADEYDCDAVLSSGDVDTVERILVPLRGKTNLDRILSLVDDLMRTSEASVTLFHSVDDDTNGHTGDSLLDDAAHRLRTSGIDRDRINKRLSESGSPSREIVELAPNFDVLVLGETEPSLRERILGALPIQTIDETNKPVFVVRKTEE
jgi:nucleotide-binding universal stress UspA family protein